MIFFKTTFKSPLNESPPDELLQIHPGAILRVSKGINNFLLHNK
jgi:hypothetical protein